MDTSAVRWFDRSPIPPARTTRRVIDILRPRPGGSYYGVCLNQELLSADTHWDPGLSGKIRCRQMWGEECPRCPDPERRWYGYMPILFFASGKVACLEVSWAAALECPALSQQRTPLRGMRLEVGRYGKGKQGRCWAKVEAYHRPIVLPPAEEMHELLDMVFGPTEAGIRSGRRGRNGGGA
jgi:hypothetical protein